MPCYLMKPFIAAVLVVLPISLPATSHDPDALGLTPTSDRAAELRFSPLKPSAPGPSTGAGRLSMDPETGRIDQVGLRSHEAGKVRDVFGHKLCKQRSISLSFKLVGTPGQKANAFLSFNAGRFSKGFKRSKYC